MLLNDSQIRDRKLIKPFNLDQLQPASYDVRIGAGLKFETERGWIDSVLDKPIRIAPGEFFLAHTEEFVSVPNDIAATFCLKSTLARLGWEHCLAGFIDPGFHGQVTLELKNALRFNYLDLAPGQLIGQIRFETLTDVSAGYGGHYQNSVGVIGARNAITEIAVKPTMSEYATKCCVTTHLEKS